MDFSFLLLILAIVIVTILVTRKGSKSKQHGAEMANAPGRNFLLVVGILTIIGGSINILMLVAGVGTVLGVYFGMFQIVAGILAIVNRVNLKATTMLTVIGAAYIVGVIAIAFNNASIAETIPADNFDITAITVLISIIFGLPLPILYTVGARKNASAYLSMDTINQNKSVAQPYPDNKTRTLNEQKMCGNCGLQNVKDDKFCSSCGTSLVTQKQIDTPIVKAFCNQCGWKNENGLNFCGNCGIKLM